MKAPRRGEEAGRDIDRALAEAARRDRKRRRIEHSPSVSDDNATFRQVDSFEIDPAASADAHKLRVIVIERVGATREVASIAKLIDEFGLTPREAEVARALAHRLSSAEIAAALRISVNTARRHSERVLEKLGVRSRREIGEVLRRCDESG